MRGSPRVDGKCMWFQFSISVPSVNVYHQQYQAFWSLEHCYHMDLTVVGLSHYSNPRKQLLRYPFSSSHYASLPDSGCAFFLFGSLLLAPSQKFINKSMHRTHNQSPDQPFVPDQTTKDLIVLARHSSVTLIRHRYLRLTAVLLPT